jgi:acetyl esterase/lipase
MSLALSALRRAMRLFVKPLFRHARRPGPIRYGTVLASLAHPAPFGGRRVREPDGMWFRPSRKASDRVILWFHGGAYLAGSAFTHRGLLGRLARESGCDIIAPGYPLAPEHPAPAAFDAACRAYDALRRKVRAQDIVLGGDSAGGGLALALLAHVLGQGEVPAGLVALSPWTDLALTGRSLADNAARDPLVPVEAMAVAVEMIRGRLPAGDPRISPLYAGFPGAPPVLITVGSTEVLRSDAERMANHLRAGGTSVTLEIQPGAPHVLAWFAPWVPEARAAIRQIAGFISSLPRQGQGDS